MTVTAFDKKSQPPALMTNDTVPVWIRHAEAWQSKHVQLHLMYEEYDKQRVRGHDVDLRKLDSTGDSDAGSGGVIWDSYASVPDQEIGERKRKVVQYDDGLTETQFINMVENEEKKQAMAKVSLCNCCDWPLLIILFCAELSKTSEQGQTKSHTTVIVFFNIAA